MSTLPEDYSAVQSGAAIKVSPNGRFVYASNRGHDSLAIYAVDPNNGKLSVVGHEPTQGKTPRDFTIDSSGSLLLAANQDSATIVTF